ncbi:MAG TPA: hypothetical protein VGD67_00450 [Pseudonocardiaceae bacterium]
MSDWDGSAPSPVRLAMRAPAVVVAATETVTAAVAEAVARTEGLDGLPVAEHVARFDVVHKALADALSAIDGA